MIEGTTSSKRLRHILGIILGLTLVVHVGVLILGGTLLSGASWPHEPLHSSLEIVGTLIAIWCAWMLISMEQRRAGTSFNIQISAALVAMGLLDGFHAICREGNNFVWLHSVATLTGGVLFATVWIPTRLWRPGPRWPLATAIAAGAIGLASLVFPQFSPLMVRGNEFTLAAEVLNIAGGVLMLAAAFRLVASHFSARNDDDLLFCLHCVLFGLAAIMFERSALWDFPWWGWHLLRLAAYGVAMYFLYTNDSEHLLARARLEAAQREAAERRLGLVVEAADSGVLMADATGKIVMVNSRLEQIFGYSRTELVGKMTEILVSAELQQQHVGHRARFMADPKVHRMGERGRLSGIHKSGRAIPIEVTLNPLELDSGPCVLATIVDITERLEAEQTLKNASAELQLIIKALPIALIFKDAGRRILHVNPAFEVIFGYSQQEVVGRTTEFLYHSFADYRDQGEKRFNPQAKFDFTPYEIPYRRKNGEVFRGETIGTSVVDEAGESLGNLSLVQDITIRRKIEREVSVKEATLRGVFDNSRSFIGLMTPDGVLIDANRTALAAAGVPLDEVLGKPFWETAWWSHSADLQSRLQESIRKAAAGERDSFEATHPTPNGVIDVDFSLSPIFDADGRVIYLLPEGRDITRRKTAETERRERQAELQLLNTELARSNQELEQFAYVASHDLQEPLRKVSSFCQLLEREYSGAIDEMGKQYIGFAVGGAERMQALIQDLLAYSRIKPRGSEVGRVDTAEALADALHNLETSILEAGATVTHDDLPTIRADSRQFVQLFQNLVGNGIKYRGDDPPKIHVGAAEGDHQWTFSVVDNGIGIDPRFHEKIFGVFKRLHGRDDYPGTGIGLAICKRIVDGVKGKIWVESTPGQGATFYFTVPAHSPQAHPVDPHPTETQPT